MDQIKPSTILVVDDNPATLYTTSRVLRGAGFQVLEAQTGTQGIELAGTGVDLIILDVNLPDISGFDVCKELRKTDATANLPIVHLSATFVKDVDKVHGLQLGADGYLTHPVEPPVLVATVNAFLRARQAEEARRQSEQNFQAIFDQAPHGIALLDPALRFLEVNPAICEILGRTREELLNTSSSKLLPAGMEQEASQMVRVLEATGAWSGMLPLVHAKGELIYLEWSVSRHAIPGVRLAIVTDVTDKRKIEADREQLLGSERAARAALERANQLKDEFLATLSHELRTPLNVIVGWAEILSGGRSSASDVSQGLDTIVRNARVQQQLIADLLDISRITSGKLRLEMEQVDLSSLADNALHAVMPAAHAKDIRVKRVLDPDAGQILGDPARLQQVLWNLVNNAVKFTPKGGSVQVNVQRVNSSVHVTVADDGQGIRPDFLPYIFERFRQQDAVITRQHGGLGLGLAIVKHLVELHGGTVSAESGGEGEGATFIVRLPLAHLDDRRPSGSTDSGHSVSAATAENGISLNGIHVLIVDDDTDGRLLVKRLLTDAGANVVDSSSADAAIEALKVHRPHLLIGDIGMPHRDGYALIRDVRAAGFTHRDLPAIALTAFARTEDRQRAMLAGYQLHLSKPVASKELLAAVVALVGRGSPA